MESLGVAAIFYGTAAFMLASALYVVLGRNLVHCAFALMGTFFGVAVLYVYLGADFLAGAQVVIYVGGVLTLMVFGVMLTNRIYNLNLSSGAIQVVPGALSAGLVFALLVWIIQSVEWGALGVAGCSGRSGTDERGHRTAAGGRLPAALRNRLGPAADRAHGRGDAGPPPPERLVRFRS